MRVRMYHARRCHSDGAKRGRPDFAVGFHMVRTSSVFLASCVLWACLQSCTESGSGTPPGLKLNEVMVENTQFPAEGAAGHLPWIEVINTGFSTVRLSDFVLRTDGDSWALPDVHLEPGQLYVLHSLQSTNASTSTFFPESTRELAVLDQSGRQLDRVRLAQLTADESFARYPNGSGEFSVYPAERVTRGAANPDTGFIRKRASKTQFRPRDSSPNAILSYDGYFWILGGWSNLAHDVWRSYTDVWKSKDAVEWELVNDSPPYIHYCSYVVWRGRMWAVGPASFSSTDGVEWRPETLQAAGSSRSLVFNDMLVNVNGPAVRGTHDGRQWFILNNAPPWGADREGLAAVVHGGRIWVMGGKTNDGTAGQVPYNDVWSSSDGVDWSLATSSAAWAPRTWTSVVAYDDKIFLFNGANRDLWPEEFGNAAEIWFTSDGAHWFELKSESLWGARHASFTVLDGSRRGGILLLAGYGHGGVTRIYNDVWNVRVSIYFSKPDGALHELATWGKQTDGSGRSPASFHNANQVFILRNRTTFTMDERWSVTGAGSRIVVGDGDPDNRVLLEIYNDGGASHPLYLSSNSVTIATGREPTIHFRDPGAQLYLQ